MYHENDFPSIWVKGKGEFSPCEQAQGHPKVCAPLLECVAEKCVCKELNKSMKTSAEKGKGSKEISELFC